MKEQQRENPNKNNQNQIQNQQMQSQLFRWAPSSYEFFFIFYSNTCTEWVFDEDKEELKERRLNIQRFKNCGLILMSDLLSTFDRSF